MNEATWVVRTREQDHESMQSCQKGYEAMKRPMMHLGDWHVHEGVYTSHPAYELVLLQQHVRDAHVGR